jgi:hypothetical protein
MRIVTALTLLIMFPFTGFCQSSRVPLTFGQGQRIEVSLQVTSTIAQQAMGQAIDFGIDATGDHSFTVTNATEDNTTLHHDVNRLRFLFDGMGQKRIFDSNEEKDMNGMFGKMAKDVLDRSYDMVIDPRGQVLMVLPETIVLEETDSRMAIVRNMLSDVLNIVYPPKKNEPGFFHIFPADSIFTGLAWTRSQEDSTGKLQELFRVTGITDSTIVIDYSSESVSVTKAEMMGNFVVTTMNHKSAGTMEVDRSTGILRSKKIKTESHGSSEAPFGTIPVTSKTVTVVSVNVKE